MTILERTHHHLKIEADGPEVINTEIPNGLGYPPTKYFVSYFEGSGTLQVSGDQSTWLETNISENTLIEVTTTLSQFFRVSASGTKIIFLTSI